MRWLRNANEMKLFAQKNHAREYGLNGEDDDVHEHDVDDDQQGYWELWLKMCPIVETFCR